MAKTTKSMKDEIVTITESAAKKIKELAKEDSKVGYGLKLFVFPGGCSGMQYGMDFEEKAAKDDVEITQHGLKVFLPKENVDMIKGSKIDFIDNDEMSGFKIENPNSAGCGCGHEEDEESSCCGGSEGSEECSCKKTK
jgi:iron-sulfur cluster assembly accessory protein